MELTDPAALLLAATFLAAGVALGGVIVLGSLLWLAGDPHSLRRRAEWHGRRLRPATGPRSACPPRPGS